MSKDYNISEWKYFNYHPEEDPVPYPDSLNMYVKIFLKGSKGEIVSPMSSRSYHYGNIKDIPELNIPYIEELKMCWSGYHFTELKTIFDWIDPGNFVCVIEPMGNIIHDSYQAKFCCNQFKVIKATRYDKNINVLFNLLYFYYNFEHLYFMETERGISQTTINHAKMIYKKYVIDLISKYQHHVDQVTGNIHDSENNFPRSALSGAYLHLNMEYYFTQMKPRDKSILPKVLKHYIHYFPPSPIFVKHNRQTYIDYLVEFYELFIEEKEGTKYDMLFSNLPIEKTLFANDKNLFQGEN